MKKILLSLICLPLFFALNTYALASKYQIELIVFQQLNTSALDSEQWPQVKPTEIKDSNNEITLLPASQFLMAKDASKLMNDPHYQILVHLAWEETPEQLDQDKTIHLYGGRAYDATGNQLSGVIQNENLPYTQYKNWEVNGTVTVNLNRYFNFNFDLYFAEPLSTLSSLSSNNYFSGKEGLFYFHLLQDRRTKSKKLNYIDHPIYGVLVEAFPE